MNGEYRLSYCVSQVHAEETWTASVGPSAAVAAPAGHC